MNTYAARIENGLVKQVIVGNAEWAASRLGGVWVDSLVKIGVGWLYIDGEFRVPQPYPSWTWSGDAWQPPVPMPLDGAYYVWSEESLEWIVNPDGGS